MKENTYPCDTCQNYIAEDGAGCSGEHICMNCGHPIPNSPTDNADKSCWAITEYPTFIIGDYWSVSGVSAIQNELYTNGTVTCGITANDAFEEYSGGIITTSATGAVNHYVNIVGWGTSDGTNYWLVRNSWGTFWGENGYFRIKQGSNLLNIESECYAASVTVHSQYTR